MPSNRNKIAKNYRISKKVLNSRPLKNSLPFRRLVFLPIVCSNFTFVNFWKKQKKNFWQKTMQFVVWANFFKRTLYQKDFCQNTCHVQLLHEEVVFN
jgi:hypothetical protein